MQNFGKIKNAFNTLLSESLGREGHPNKKLFVKYVKALRESEILKTQFMVYTNIENKIEENEYKATQYVKENLALLEKFGKEKIEEANAKLSEIVDLVDSDYEKKNLHENITNLIFTKKNAETIDEIVDSIGNIVEYIKSNKPKELVEGYGLPNSLLLSVSTEKFNDRYPDLTEDEKRALQIVIEGDVEKKKETLTTYVRECVDLIDNKLNESELDEKDKLLKVKDKLLRMEYTKDSFVTNMSKLVELKSDLN